MATPRRSTTVQVTQQGLAQSASQVGVNITGVSELSLEKAVMSKFEEVNVLCLQLDSSAELSEFLSKVEMAKIAWLALNERMKEMATPLVQAGMVVDGE
jgi:hypothetical protein